MSRSYKKHPWCCDKPAKGIKRCANSKVRSVLKDPNVVLKGSDYKKVFESWDICDYKWFDTWETYWAREWRYYYKYGGDKPDFKKCYRDWLKWYKRK